jgi:hypothetical protein
LVQKPSLFPTLSKMIFFPLQQNAKIYSPCPFFDLILVCFTFILPLNFIFHYLYYSSCFLHVFLSFFFSFPYFFPQITLAHIPPGGGGYFPIYTPLAVGGYKEKIYLINVVGCCYYITCVYCSWSDQGAFTGDMTAISLKFLERGKRWFDGTNINANYDRQGLYAISL